MRRYSAVTGNGTALNPGSACTRSGKSWCRMAARPMTQKSAPALAEWLERECGQQLEQADDDDEDDSGYHVTAAEEKTKRTNQAASQSRA